MSSLASKTCVPCRGGTPALKGIELDRLLKEIPHWQIVNDHHITRSFTFANFKEALAFTNKIGAIAEEQGHHPDILLAWGRVEVTLWTHAAKGLTESDFILAARFDEARGAS
jgi:4a-hydroxytetrahydrobiopterin dehydratase